MNPTTILYVGYRHCDSRHVLRVLAGGVAIALPERTVFSARMHERSAVDIPPPANAGEDPFDWGSAEFVDGCYRLALAILADAFDDSVAVQDFARFVSGWIVALDDDAWILTVGDLREWIERTRAEEAAGDLDAFKLGGTANGGAR